MILVILGAITLLMILSLSFTTLVNLRITRNDTLGLKAFAVAECGVERVLAEWIVDPEPVEGTIYTDVPFIDSVSGEIGTYTVVVTDLGSDQWQIESTGKSTGAHRKISVKVEVGLGGPNGGFSNAVFSDAAITLFSNSEIWGDVYINGQPSWNNGTLRATDSQGTHFSYNPTIEEAPYGRLTYYYPDEDTWQIVEAPDDTNTGDAHGFWLSSQEVENNNTWLPPQLNIGGNPEDEQSNQYWNRRPNQTEYYYPPAAKEYSENTGIAVKGTDGPFIFPVIGNGTRNNFISYYNGIAPNSTKYENITIYEYSTLCPIELDNGYNEAIIGSTANGKGFPTQFIWQGEAIRNNGSTYTGPLIFDEGFILYVDGNVEIQDDISQDSLTIIASGYIDVDTNNIPQENFNLIAYNDIIIKTNANLNGIYYSNTLVTMDANPQINGALIARDLDFIGGSSSITFNKEKVLSIGSWLPGGSDNTVNLISWNEVVP